jgi:NAD(P)-dependent dehydrogenase (short-subunit alcohol dehydrogenase family)
MSVGPLDDKVAFVTGSTRGVGEGIAHVMAADGAKVVVTGRNTDDGARVVKDIGTAGGTAHYIRVDFGDEQAIKDAIAETKSVYGRLDVLVNNVAPTDHYGPGRTDNIITELSSEGWRQIMNDALDSLFWVSKEALKLMVADGGGAIVNISSGVAREGMAGASGYTASKGAMQSLTRSMAVEYAQHGIRCNCLILGPFRTAVVARLYDQHPKFKQAFEELTLLGRIGEPEDVGHAVSFLASDKASFITGVEFPLDGGMMCRMALPNLAVV